MTSLAYGCPNCEGDEGPAKAVQTCSVITMAHGQGGAEIGFDRGPTLTCNHEAPIAAYGIRTANTSSNGWGIQEEVTHTLDCARGVAVAQPVSFAIQAGALRTNPASGPDGIGVQADHAYTLEARAEVQAIAFPANLSGTQCASTEDLAPAMGAKNPTAVATGAFFAGQGAKAGSIAYSADIAPTLKASDSGTNRTPSAHIGMQVRRLTPREAERLQGFPDGYTAIPWRKKPADQCPDGPRYKALGNSWAVPNVRWIGARIDAALRGKP